jgi:hypothetical protein
MPHKDKIGVLLSDGAPLKDRKAYLKYEKLNGQQQLLLQIHGQTHR